MANVDMTFLKGIKDLPLLTAEREKELGAVIQKDADGSVKDQAIVEMVEHNLKLVVKEAFRYSRRCQVTPEELYNAGRKGLIRAVYEYKPEQFGTRFSTYATPWIRQGMREIIRNSTPVKIPVHIVNGLYRKGQALEKKSGMTDKELCEELEVTDIQLERINKAQITSISLDMPINTHDADSGDMATFGDLMADENAKIPGENGIKDARHDYLEEAMGELDDMSRDIVMSQVLQADKVKLSALGEKYGISGERVRQIKAKALSSLKKKIVYRMRMNGQEPTATALPPKPAMLLKKRGRPRKKTAK